MFSWLREYTTWTIDTSALIAVILDEPDAASMLSVIAAQDRVLPTAANWLETQIVVSVRARGRLDTLHALMDAIPHEIVPVTAALADAAFIAFTRYGQGQHPAALNFGDCFSYALARVRSVPLLFKGDDFSRTDVLIAG